jgi:hypothetical protein
MSQVTTETKGPVMETNAKTGVTFERRPKEEAQRIRELIRRLKRTEKGLPEDGTGKLFPRDERVTAIHRARVNVKSLAAEARLIRQEERRAGWVYREELARHRRGRLRDEARYAGLALAFIRGRAYSAVENNAKPGHRPDLVRLAKKIVGFWRFPMPAGLTADEVVSRWLLS